MSREPESSNGVDAASRPLITSHDPDWIRGIALKGSSEPFEHIGALSEMEGYDTIMERGTAEGIRPELLEAAIKDSAPIPATVDREMYHGDDHIGFWLSGLIDAQKWLDTFDEHGQGELNRALELGCATGRVLRHLKTVSSADCYGCDLNLRHVEWMRMNLDPSIAILHNTAIPSLPFEDRYFDSVAAFSVFTHIDEFEANWLLELRRILAPGGLAYLTIHTEHTWEEHGPGWIQQTYLPMAAQITEFDLSEEFFSSPLPSPKTVLWWQTQSVYNSTVFHSEDYIRREWGRHFEILEIRRGGHNYQDVVVLQKPMTGEQKA